jgi:hypothetical protein
MMIPNCDFLHILWLLHFVKEKNVLFRN